VRRSGDIVILTGCVPTGIVFVIRSVAESITATESDEVATTNKFCAKAEGAKRQATTSKTVTTGNGREQGGFTLHLYRAGGPEVKPNLRAALQPGTLTGVDAICIV
jgi:hypothetical protein